MSTSGHPVSWWRLASKMVNMLLQMVNWKYNSCDLVDSMIKGCPCDIMHAPMTSIIANEL